MIDADGAPARAVPALYESIQRSGSQELRAGVDALARAYLEPGRHLRRRRRGAAVPARHRARGSSTTRAGRRSRRGVRQRVTRARGVPRRRLRRHCRGGRRRRRAAQRSSPSSKHFHRAGVRHRAAERRARARRRHRPDPRRAGQLPRARGQRARAVRRQLRAREPQRDAPAVGRRARPGAAAAGVATTRSGCSPRCAPRRRRASTDPCVVVLTPGVYNSAYFEHALAGPGDGRRAGRGTRPGLLRRRRAHARHLGRAAGRRDLPPRRRRVPRPGAVPRRLGARLPGPAHRGARRQRHHRQRGRQRRRRRQADLHLPARPRALLPRRGAGAAATSTPGGSRTRRAARRCSTASTSWSSSRSTARAARGSSIGPQADRRRARRAAHAAARRPARLDRAAGRAAVDRPDADRRHDRARGTSTCARSRSTTATTCGCCRAA